ncbi:hypothetical protein [Roseibacillus ishigakijimensis]|uniref:HEAT repeat-containing protein n=1 Tax=Roseibacillus ishigakijimensis TaxID=454146 RepID=A0A934RTL1_9BACT|nr:hypothetical protein [Roseibacillus ishigakijimensis]MBK1835722.1 hypothetical protein [Roseibacillus ishigakijimensis]
MDWDRLANELNCPNQGGDALAQEGIARILGEEFIREAVDKAIVIVDPGSELARSVLIFLRSRGAVDYALEIYRDTPDLELKRSVVNLLKAISDETILEVVPEFLAHEDEGIQNWGAAIVDQLAFSGMIDEDDCSAALSIMESHSNPQVRWHREEVLKELAR